MASVDDAETNKKFATEHEADFPILSDPDKGVATSYGVLGELLVRLGIVDAGGEIDDVGEGPDVVAALTERLALGRSTTGERFREPGQDDGLAFQRGETVRLPVRTRE